jgi:hypothetical protein
MAVRKRASHLFQDPRVTAAVQERIEFGEINGGEMFQTLKPTLIDDFLNKAGEHCFVLCCCHGILSFSPRFWNSVNGVLG